jgi:hypothetical protein
VIRLLALIALVGCTRVAAHEREHLARRAMDPERDATETQLDTHVHEYREGSIGGTGVGGGGCGCN